MEPFVRMEGAGPALYLLRDWMEESPGLTAGITGREGGTSGPPWTSLNCGLHVGDDAEAVVRNRALAAEAAGWDPAAWTCAEQVHGCRVHRVVRADRGRGGRDAESAIPGADAIMTDEPGILLASYYADCVPLLFHDPSRGAVALAHAGWRGTVLEIAARTVEAMEREFGSRPADIRAAIGPAIGPCCYEVDGPVIERALPLAESLASAGGAPLDAMIRMTEDGKARLNLKEMNRQIMIRSGIMPSSIAFSSFCTGCRRDLFFSHRREGGRTGRMASFIGMRER